MLREPGRVAEGADRPPTRPDATRACPGRARDPQRRTRAPPARRVATRVEARVAFPSMEDEIPTPTRRFTVWETTSGLPDDSREADERASERRLRDLRGRVKAARALVSSTPGLSEVLGGNWKKAARFYARFGITQEMFRHGAIPGDLARGCLTEAVGQPMNALAETGEHIRAVP